jgi:hypothetical protein
VLSFVSALLRQSALFRSRFAITTGTKANYSRSLRLYLDFCKGYGFKALSPSLDCIMLFIEWLAQRALTQGTVLNHISAIKFYLKLKKSTVLPFSCCFPYSYFLKV